MECGLLGKTLAHSYSPQIHKFLGDYTYTLHELEESQIEDFLKGSSFTGLNVTIPYKKTVMPFLDVISPEAKAIGSVNTVVRKDGKLYGCSTDGPGLEYALEKEFGFSAKDKNILFLGAGGACLFCA